MAVEDLSIGSAGVLDAAIGMVDETLGRRAMPDHHHQGVLAQRTPQMVGHAPADDLAGRHVLDGRQVQPALVRGHIRNVRQPDRIRAIRLEGALEQVRGDAVAVAAVGRDRRPLLAPGRSKAVFPHEPGDPLAGDADAADPQFGMDARSPIALAAVLENAPDLANEVGFGAALR